METTAKDLIDAGAHPIELVSVDRDSTIKIIREALKDRSGKSWSVKGGRGTGYGWITICAPPKRMDGWKMTEEDQKELASLLALDYVHQQGETIPAASDYRREYIARAKGLPVLERGQRYWD